MENQSLTEQGIAALKSGDKAQARDLLQQAVEADPQDERAWYYLAGAQDDADKRREALEKVIEINPLNEKAQSALTKMQAKADDVVDEVKESVTKATASSPMEQEIDLPVDIPGAPESVTAQGAINTFIEIFKNGMDVLQRKPGAYAEGVQTATWWRFWVYAIGAFIITSIASTISGIIVQNQIAAFAESVGASAFGITFTRPTLINIILTLILTIPISIAVWYAGMYASHWFVTTQRNGQGSFEKHAYTIALPAITASIIGNVISMVFFIVPLLGAVAGLITLVLVIYSYYIAHGGLTMLHKVDSNSAVLTLVVMFIAQIVVGFVLGAILGGVLLTSGGFGFF